MDFLKQIVLLAEDEEKKEIVDGPEDKADEIPAEPADEDDGDDEEETEDVGSVVASQGFEKESKEMFAFGETRKVTVLTKSEPLGGLDVTYQYVINPKTGSWTLSACLKGQSEEDMVEFHSGEDPTSLIASLKSSERITPKQAVENLNPPVGT